MDCDISFEHIKSMSIFNEEDMFLFFGDDEPTKAIHNAPSNDLSICEILELNEQQSPDLQKKLKDPMVSTVGVSKETSKKVNKKKRSLNEVLSPTIPLFTYRGIFLFDFEHY